MVATLTNSVRHKLIQPKKLKTTPQNHAIFGLKTRSTVISLPTNYQNHWSTKTIIEKQIKSCHKVIVLIIVALVIADPQSLSHV